MNNSQARYSSEPIQSVLWQRSFVIPNAHANETSKGPNAIGAITNRRSDCPIKTIPMQPTIIAASVTVTPDFFIAKLLPTNDYVDRAPANTVSKIRNGPTGASVQHFVRPYLVLRCPVCRFQRGFAIKSVLREFFRTIIVAIQKS